MALVRAAIAGVKTRPPSDADPRMTMKYAHLSSKTMLEAA